MNAHQRRKHACAKHYRMPLGCAVKVTITGAHNTSVSYIGAMGKHDSSGRCIVNFEQHNVLTLKCNPYAAQPFAWVTYASVKPLAVHRVRPWWRVLREDRRNGVRK